VKKFTPDFYLPQYDLFIEITTLDQRLVTKKNRKVRRLRELHPEIKCKVFYERDYLNLLVKYGLEEPAQKTLVRAPRSRRSAPTGGEAAAAEGDEGSEAASDGSSDVSSAL
jgi:hypoxanthine phosphoribosyltransferase